MQRRARLQAEPLEPRDTPAVFGTPWPDGQHLTLSLAPDGTPIVGQAGNLASFLQQLGPESPMSVLWAFQSWAAEANLNVGLVADSGAAFGTGGPVQGDPRFGDLRVGGRALARDVLAVTAPYAVADNYSGDVVVNTATKFGTGDRDLFTAMLQESGHAFGVGNSPDPTSVMYEYYLGPRQGLSAGDVASIQALYGARSPDRFESSSGNDTLATATPYPKSLEADLTTAADVDVYKVTTGLLTTGLTVNLRAGGLSLVTAKVELLDAAGNVVASGQAADPTQNDVKLSAAAQGGATYYARVSAARADLFGVGAYDLDVAQQSAVSTTTGTANGLLDETGLNDTLATATTLLTQSLQVGPQTEYHAEGGFGPSGDVDYYRIWVPPSGSGGPVNLVTTAWGENGAVLSPWVEVDDALGNKLDAQVFTADGNTTTLQVRGLQPGGQYFLKVTSDTGARGLYELAADLRADALAMPRGGSGTLDVLHPTAAATLNVAQTNQVHFVLSAAGSSGQAVLTVTAKDGTVAARLAVPVGRGKSVDVFLPAGAYQVAVAMSGTGSPVTFAVGVLVVTDPVGASAADPTGTPEQGDSGGGSGGNGGGSGGSSSGSGSSGSGSSTDPAYWGPDQCADAAYWY